MDSGQGERPNGLATNAAWAHINRGVDKEAQQQRERDEARQRPYQGSQRSLRPDRRPCVPGGQATGVGASRSPPGHVTA